MLHYVAAYSHSRDDGFFGGLLVKRFKSAIKTTV